MKSMTGYGRSEHTACERRVSVEIKSVNHKYSELQIKMPRLLNALEDRLRKFILSKISRGKVDVYVSFESFSQGDIKIDLNKPLLDAYVGRLSEIKSEYNLKDDISLSILTRMPEVMVIDKKIEDEELVWGVLEAAANDALSSFIAMRQKEGNVIHDDINKKLADMSASVGEIEKRYPQSLEEARQKLQARIKEMLGDAAFDESRILTEVAILSDRSCVDEELTRLASHINQMKDIMQEKDPIGRKLDFLIQEMIRESNTIGSKSSDLYITKMVLSLKSDIEKIREQIQNIE